VSEGRPATPARRPDDARPRRREGPGSAAVDGPAAAGGSATADFATTADGATAADVHPPASAAAGAEPEPPSTADLEAVERQMVELTELSGATVEHSEDLRALIVRRARRGPVFNYLAKLRWPADGWQAYVAVAEQRFHDVGEWPSVLVADQLTTPAGLAARLERLGWVPMERETILWTRRAAIVPHLDASLRVEAVTARTVPLHEELERHVFELADSTAEDRRARIADAIATGRLRAFLVRLHGEPVAIARLTARDGVAALYGIGVAEGHRGAGLGRLITTVATRAGLATGNRLVWLSVDESNATASRLYASLDFRPAFSWTRLLGPAS
jgi:ribosomal protein S18 acetylase RimI-like enzyme